MIKPNPFVTMGVLAASFVAVMMLSAPCHAQAADASVAPAVPVTPAAQPSDDTGSVGASGAISALTTPEPGVPSDTQSFGAAVASGASTIQQAVQSGHATAIVVAIVLCILVFGIRLFFGALFPSWLTDKGGVLLALVTSFAGAVFTSVVGGQPITLQTVYSAFMVAGMGSGFFVWAKKFGFAELLTLEKKAGITAAFILIGAATVALPAHAQTTAPATSVTATTPAPSTPTVGLTQAQLQKLLAYLGNGSLALDGGKVTLYHGTGIALSAINVANCTEAAPCGKKVSGQALTGGQQVGLDYELTFGFFPKSGVDQLVLGTMVLYGVQTTDALGYLGLAFSIEVSLPNLPALEIAPGFLLARNIGGKSILAPTQPDGQFDRTAFAIWVNLPVFTWIGQYLPA